LTRYLTQVLQRALTSLKGDSGGLEVVNQLLVALIQRVQQGAVEPSPTGSPDSQRPGPSLVAFSCFWKEKSPDIHPSQKEKL